MTITLSARFGFELDSPTSMLLQFEAAALPDQTIIEATTRITPAQDSNRVQAQDGIGERVWLHSTGKTEVEYNARLDIERRVSDLHRLSSVPVHALPGEAVQYLLDSRYCRADKYQALTANEFAGTTGGARIAAIRDWIGEHFTYAPGTSDVNTDATDTFIARAGICRDFAHVLVTLARASAIPARYVACFAPGVTPQDFHAVAQVFLADPEAPSQGKWHLVDATGMADLSKAAIIGVGRDAADVSFITSFGPMRFLYSSVDVSRSG
ncbi:MAG: transglutaminase family protein [Pseudomonadota bacterium]|nr:transglutaminase family protein [Pseudomonadota bacterium]